MDRYDEGQERDDGAGDGREGGEDLEARRVRVQLVGLQVGQVAARADHAHEVVQRAREVVGEALSQVADHAREARDVRVRDAVERLADPSPMEAVQRERLERLIYAARAERELGLEGVNGTVGDAAGEHVLAGREAAEVALEAARRAQEIAQDAHDRVASYERSGLTSDELEQLRTVVAGDARDVDQAVQEAVDAADRAAEQARRAVTALDERDESEGAQNAAR